jgi:flagellar hook-associated protein 1 FlgK
MSSILGSLNNARTSLQTAQVGVDVTSNNIANAENENYTRQRVVQTTADSIVDSSGLELGNGTKIAEITRIHDEFVYSRLQISSERKSFSDTQRGVLEEVSQYLPDMDEVGIKNDLQNYFKEWSALSQDANSSAQKTALESSATVLATDINSTYERISKLRDDVNEQINISVTEVNSYLERIADINKDIFNIEATGKMANELRDKRDSYETAISKLIGGEFTHSDISSNSGVNMQINEGGGIYSIVVGGFTLVSGTSHHKIKSDNVKDPNGFYHISYPKSDGTQEPMDSLLKGGKIGALLSLRGDKFGENNEIKNGILTETMDNLNTFSAGLIQHTNNIYAENATNRLESNYLNIEDETKLNSPELNINAGTFDLVIYDDDGEEISRRTIEITEDTTFNHFNDKNSLMQQLTKEVDDNGDNSIINDFAYQFDVTTRNDKLYIEPSREGNQYSIAIEDNGTNFAGSFGLNRFFEGTDASDIEVNHELHKNPENIRASKSPNEGDSSVAIKMMELENKEFSFTSQLNNQKIDSTMFGFYDLMAGELATVTESSVIRNESITAQYNAIELEFQSISKVNIDEELVSLMKYQTAYSASGKVITTIDQMIDTLLGLKQ